jgi:hypothetical protein
VVLHRSGAVLEQVEGHPLEDPPALALVPVLDVAELLDQLGLQAGLLADLAPGRLLHGLALVGMALGQPEHPAPLGRELLRHDHGDLVVAHDDPAGRELALDRHQKT